MRWILISSLLGSLAAGCGDATLKGQGEPCFATSECSPGLLCDLVATPATCQSMQSVRPDAAAEPDVDAATPEPDASVQPDANVPMPDAAPTPDAAVPDAAVPDAAVPDAAIIPDAAALDAM